MSLIYHLTPIENKELILNEGIKCNEEGHIYIMTEYILREPIFQSSVLLSDIISYDQLGMDEYSLFHINIEGIINELEYDNVGELVSRYQKIVRQDIISPEYIKFVEDRTVNMNEYKKYKFCVYKILTSPEYGNLDSRKLNFLREIKKIPIPFTNKLKREMNEYYNQQMDTFNLK